MTPTNGRPEPVGHGLAEEGRRLLEAANNAMMVTELHNPRVEIRAWFDWLHNNAVPLLEAAEHVATLQSSHDLALAEAERLREAAQSLSDFAWSAVCADCDESRAYLQSLIDGLRAALKPKEPDHAR